MRLKNIEAFFLTEKLSPFFPDKPFDENKDKFNKIINSYFYRG